MKFIMGTQFSREFSHEDRLVVNDLADVLKLSLNLFSNQIQKKELEYCVIIFWLNQE
ncbi:MAG: hypothetical protein ABI576_05125 [Flavobacterium sp.]